MNKFKDLLPVEYLFLPLMLVSGLVERIIKKDERYIPEWEKEK